MGEKDTARRGKVVELFGEDAPEAYQPRPWRDGIVANIRAVPADVDRRFRKEFTSQLKARQLGEQSAEKVIVRGEEVTASRAIYALGSFVGYVFTTRSPEIAKALAEALEAPVAVGAEIDLDGKWSDAVKAVIFHYAPKIAKWISDEADKLAGQEAANEEDTAGN